MLKSFQFDFEAFMLSNITPITLQTAIIWCYLNAMKICNITSFYQTTCHIILLMTIFYVSKKTTSSKHLTNPYKTEPCLSQRTLFYISSPTYTKIKSLSKFWNRIFFKAHTVIKFVTLVTLPLLKRFKMWLNWVIELGRMVVQLTTM